MGDMNYEQKLLALRALGGLDTSVHIRSEGDWYVRVPGVEIKEGNILRSLSGNGDTPSAAVDDCWASLAGRELVVKATSAERASYRWSGFMWEKLEAPLAA